jgi:hypothetical protein
MSIAPHPQGALVANHERLWGRHQMISGPEHVAAAKGLRRERIGLVRPVPEPEVEIRCLGDYETRLGPGQGCPGVLPARPG